MAAAIIGIISSLLPLAIKLITAYLDRQEGDTIAKEKFLDFIGSMEESMKTPSKLRKTYKEQGDRLRERLKKLQEESK